MGLGHLQEVGLTRLSDGVDLGKVERRHVQDVSQISSWSSRLVVGPLL